MPETAGVKNVWKSTLVYFGALIFNIILGWILAKINTHYLSVGAYGVYSFFLIFLFMSRAFFGFGLFESVSRHLALTGDELKRRQYFGTALVWSLIFSVVFSLVMLLASLFIDRLFEVQIGDLIFRYAWCSGLILLNTFLLLALRGFGKIGLMAETTIYPRIFYLIFLIPLISTASFTLDGTLLALFAGYALTILLIVFRLHPSFTAIGKRSSQLRAEMRSYGIHMYVSAIWHELLFHADKLIVSIFMDERSIAFYALAYMLTFPLSHFSTSLSSTMFARFSRAEKIDRRVILVNLAFIVSSVLLFILLRKEIILRLFSADYLPSVILITPLALAFDWRL